MDRNRPGVYCPDSSRCCKFKFHGGLTKEQSDILESIQKRALRIIAPRLSYNEALEFLKLETLSDHRRKLCLNVFTQMQKPAPQLNCLLPALRETRDALRTRKALYPPKCKTNRYKNSFVSWCLFNLQ